MTRKEKAKKRSAKKGKDYTFWRQFNEKPSIVLGCPGVRMTTYGWSLSCCSKVRQFLCVEKGLKEILHNSC